MSSAQDDMQNTQADTTDSTYPDLLNFRISPELSEKIAEASKVSKIPRSTLLRLAVDRGIDRLLEQLNVQTEAQA